MLDISKIVRIRRMGAMLDNSGYMWHNTVTGDTFTVGWFEHDRGDDYDVIPARFARSYCAAPEFITDAMPAMRDMSEGSMIPESIWWPNAERICKARRSVQLNRMGWWIADNGGPENVSNILELDPSLIWLVPLGY